MYMAYDLTTVIPQYITPETMVIIFTVIGALATSIVDVKKRKKLSRISGPVIPSDSAFELAKKALEQVEKAATECSDKFNKLSDKYEDLEEKYYKQIEITTKQAELISKLNIELVYFKSEMMDDKCRYDDISSEDKDPGF